MAPRLPFLTPPDLAIDLGTANTLVHARGRGIVLNEPSVVALGPGTGGTPRVLAVGQAAKRMLGRAPEGIAVVRPIADGVIADPWVAEAMLRHLMRTQRGALAVQGPSVLVCVPYGATPEERAAILAGARRAGAREAMLIAEPLAAAIGAGLPIEDAAGAMVVDIGGGTTEVAVLALGDVVRAESLRVGGDSMDEAIAGWVEQEHGLLIGQGTAERVKLEIGAAAAPGNGADGALATIGGRDLAHGVPREVVVSQRRIANALYAPVAAIAGAVREVLAETPPELAADIVSRGMVLTGGGALLPQLDAVLRDATGLPVLVAEEPLACVVQGTAAALANRRRFAAMLRPA